MAFGKVEKMLIKVVGSLLIVLACGGVGIMLTISHKNAEKAIKMLILNVEFIQRELQYRMTPLPDILCSVSKQSDCFISRFFHDLVEEMEKQISPSITHCAEAALGGLHDVPECIKRALTLLAHSLGQFDIDGQIGALDSVKTECQEILSSLKEDREVRLRNYQTIAICAGIVIVIIFL